MTGKPITMLGRAASAHGFEAVRFEWPRGSGAMHVVMAKPLDGPGERGWWYHVYPPEVIIPRMPEPASEAPTEAGVKRKPIDSERS
jgi:hypothetical protein